MQPLSTKEISMEQALAVVTAAIDKAREIGGRD